jgi:ATP-binding cassette subfamily B protein
VVVEAQRRRMPVRDRGDEAAQRGLGTGDGDDRPWVLRGVTFDLPAGAAVALAGHNGAGKTTLVKLLCRMYDPVRGSIRWDGVDLRDLAPEELRERIAAVFQDSMEYDLTAAENVGLGDLAGLDDRARIVAAARLAGIDETLAGLPRGYDTMLSQMFLSEEDDPDTDRGFALSGGQWQRVALARALMRGQRDLMILDEPTAGMDAVAEHEVHVRLQEHRTGRTSLLISHRLSALRSADRIVVLDGGVVAEQGGHDELVAAGGTYARLFTIQAAGYLSTVPR